MIITSSLFLLILMGLFLTRRAEKRAITKTTLLLEILATATLSYLAALIIWLFANHFSLLHSTGVTWLIWLLMFICGVIGVRTLGNRLKETSQETKNIWITPFAKELAYHASVFWKLITVIAMMTFISTSTPPNNFFLLSLSFTLTVALIMESAVKLFRL